MESQVAKLVLLEAGGHGREFTLSGGGATLGRGAVNDIIVGDPKASRLHARIDCDGEVTLHDLGSGNGTYVNGVRVAQAVLTPGDSILIGETALRFELGPPAAAESGLTRLDSEVDLDSTLVGARLPVSVRDTRHPRLAVHTPARTWEVDLGSDAVSIGRSGDNDVVLDDQAVSRHHARLERRGFRFVVRDLGSANGTWVAGRRVDEQPLSDGDTLALGAAQLVFKQGFDPDALTVVDTPLSARRKARTPVVFIPGAMGSELWAGSQRIWPNVRRFFTHPQEFRLPSRLPLRVGSVLRDVVIVPNLLKLERYSRVTEYLEEGLGYELGKDLLEFPYDWRQDVRLAARQLGEALDGWDAKPPITIVAHSLGCLVSRYYVERLGGRAKVGRLVLLGGPHGGCPKAVSWLALGQALPMGILAEQVRGVMGTFPSAYQILPASPCATDERGREVHLLEGEGWLPEEQRTLLRDAREFRRELGAASSVPCVSVMGYGLKTITRFKVRRAKEGRWSRVDFLAEDAGDDTIPESCAVAPGSDVHPVHQHHSSLFADGDFKMRLKLELTRPVAAR